MRSQNEEHHTASLQHGADTVSAPMAEPYVTLSMKILSVTTTPGTRLRPTVSDALDVLWLCLGRVDIERQSVRLATPIRCAAATTTASFQWPPRCRSAAAPRQSGLMPQRFVA